MQFTLWMSLASRLWHNRISELVQVRVCMYSRPEQSSVREARATDCFHGSSAKPIRPIGQTENPRQRTLTSSLVGDDENLSCPISQGQDRKERSCVVGQSLANYIVEMRQYLLLRRKLRCVISRKCSACALCWSCSAA